MIKFHPSDTSLINFANGDLPFAEGLMVSSHCDYCVECQHKLETYTEQLAEKHLSVKPLQVHSEDVMNGDAVSACFSQTGNEQITVNDVNDDSFLSMFDSIVSTGSEHKPPLGFSRYDAQKQYIQLEGKQFHVPETLRKYAEAMGAWSHLIGKVWQAPVDIGGGILAQFIYMEKGGGVPEHTHKGNEFTLVLDGSFEDGLSTYETGDFIALTAQQTHTPVSSADEGCLVFSIVDKPLHFTSGWAKFINPLSDLYFKVKIHR